MDSRRPILKLSPSMARCGRDLGCALRYARYGDTIPYEIIARHLSKNPVILEAGADNGVNTEQMAEFWPEATIHAFESVPAARARLIQRTAHFGPREQVHAAAIGEVCGEGMLNLSQSALGGGTQSSSLLKPPVCGEEFPYLSYPGSLPVSITTLDAWKADNQIEDTDFLWLDMQGMELAALRGGGLVLATAKAIHLEVFHLPLYDGAPVFGTVADWLQAQGFVIAAKAVFRLGGTVLFVRR